MSVGQRGGLQKSWTSECTGQAPPDPHGLQKSRTSECTGQAHSGVLRSPSGFRRARPDLCAGPGRGVSQRCIRVRTVAALAPTSAQGPVA
eukprot:9422330-Alexandrium_andersonii.AAC.1